MSHVHVHEGWRTDPRTPVLLEDGTIRVPQYDPRPENEFELQDSYGLKIRSINYDPEAFDPDEHQSLLALQWDDATRCDVWSVWGVLCSNHKQTLVRLARKHGVLPNVILEAALHAVLDSKRVRLDRRILENAEGE